MNVKCNPLLTGSLRLEPGIYPAYHMNKAAWRSLSVEDVDEKTLKLLLDMSVHLTAPKIRRRKGGSTP